MGRHKTTIEFNPEALRKALQGKETFSERAESYGVSRQAVHGWLKNGRIPPRALAEIAIDLKLSVLEMTEILTIVKTSKRLEDGKKLIYSIEVYQHEEDDEAGR